MALTLNNVPQQQAQGLTLSNVPQQPMMPVAPIPQPEIVVTGQRMPQQPTMPVAPQQPVGGLTVGTQTPQRGTMLSYDPAAQYRQFSTQLADMIKSGQITPERANQLKAPLFEATKLGNSFEGYKAMQAAQQNATGMMPRQGYDPAAEYRGLGTTIGSMMQNQYNPDGLTPAQANAMKAAMFEATKMGNTNAGYDAMQKAIAAADAQLSVPLRGVPNAPMPPQQPAAPRQLSPEEAMAITSAQQPTGMALGGLMRKYGGMC
jgi:hypothetical protein